MSKELIEKAMKELGIKKGQEEQARAVLEQMLKDARPAFGKARKDRESFIPQSTDLTEIRREMKTAYASKSKMKNKPEAVERYKAHIEICQARINELHALANQADDPIKTLLEFNEDTSFVLQRLIEAKETELKAQLEPYFNKAAMKRAANLFKASIPDSLKKEILDRINEKALEFYESRVRNFDQRCLNLNKLVRLAAADLTEVQKRLEAKKEATA